MLPAPILESPGVSPTVFTSMILENAEVKNGACKIIMFIFDPLSICHCRYWSTPLVLLTIIHMHY